MDYLTRISMEHGRIYESMAIFNQALDIQNGNSYTNVDKVARFFNDLVVPHFQYEEAKLFCLMAEQGTGEEKILVESLIVDHQRILKAIDDISSEVEKCGSQDGCVGDKLYNLVKNTIGDLLDHARQEDRSFYPNIKKYLMNL